MKTISKTIEVTAKNFRPVNGKAFAFLRTDKGDAFISPPELRKLQDGYKHATIKIGAKGLEATLASYPATETVLEAGDYEVCKALAAKGLLFEKSEAECIERRIWMKLPRDQKNEVYDINCKSQEMKKWAGLSLSQVVSKILGLSKEFEENDPYNQALPWDIKLSYAKKAQACGVTGLEKFIAEQELEAENFQKSCNAKEEERMRQEQSEAVEFQQEIASLKTILDKRGKKLGHWDLIKLSKQIRGGKTAQEVVDNEFAPKTDSGGVDTFGFCHGEDFEGGTW